MGQKCFENIKRNIYANKKPIGFGLSWTCSNCYVHRAEKPEMTKEVLPYKTSDGNTSSSTISKCTCLSRKRVWTNNKH